MSACDLFTETKTRLPITEAFTAYGITLNRHNRAKCPFHGGGNERTASMQIYPATNSWFCYGCGQGGSAIDLISGLFGLEPLAAAQKLNADFQLGIDTNKPPDSKALQSLNEDRKLLKDFETWIPLLLRTFAARYGRYNFCCGLVLNYRQF